jgi:2-dehydro-3-deoxyphosphogluconate aldolase/(4S)-4-hydroxy-2-oxoglutarate aldolase
MNSNFFLCVDNLRGERDNGTTHILEDFRMTSVLNRIVELGVVPVIAIDSVDHALPLADALLEGGLPIVEITFRTAAAAEVIRVLAKERPALVVGAGTVLSPETVQTAVDAGAQFAVAPGLSPRVVQAAKEAKLPFVPGIANPSDIEAGLELGCKLLKFFPAEALGGTKLLTALSAPYKHTGVKFMPTGGASMANLEAYLKIDTVAAVGGTWIAKKEDMAAGKWSEIAQRCRDARALVQRIRA